MNRRGPLVYMFAMRPWIFILIAAPIVASAQPEPPSFCFTLARDARSLRPLQQSLVVVQYYQERFEYVGSTGSYLGPEQELVLHGGPLFHDNTQHWVVYRPHEGPAKSRLVVVCGKDTMHIDQPEDPLPLMRRAWLRWDRDTPEVIRFRKGRYRLDELVDDPGSIKATNRVARQLIAEEEAEHKQELADLEEYYRNQPRPTPPRAPYIPPPPMTEDQWAAFWAEQPPLKKVEVERVNADTVWVRFNGRVMLNGACSSGMPLFGMEMRTDTGWVERIPFDLTQMDCGMPWGDWEGHVVMIPPLRWWVGVHQPEGKKEVAPGSYRLIFMGGNMQESRTDEFVIGP